MKSKHYIRVLVFMSLLFQTCDPTYPVSIKNSNETEIIVDSKLTKSFNPGLMTTFVTDENNRLQFKIESEQEFECGFSIGELKNDLPFSELIIYKKKDTFNAKDKSEVLNLFDKNWIGNLKTPYGLTAE